jgi:subtilisin family serine protease
VYEANISRANPSAFVFLIDQSGSMAEPWGGETGKAKADAVATDLNKLIQNLVLRCAKEEGIRDYYEVAVIGYGAGVGSALGGILAGENLVPVSRLGANPIRVEDRTKKVDDGAGGILEQQIKLPIWVDPKAENGTPMTAALDYARGLLAPWVAAHPASFPPIVINISDGAPTDGDPTTAAAALTALATSDGPVLLMNINISAAAGAPIEFPASADGLADEHARLLFGISSVLPPYMRSAAAQEELRVTEGSRGFTFQGDAVATIRFLDIGTRPSNMAVLDAPAS